MHTKFILQHHVYLGEILAEKQSRVPHWIILKRRLFERVVIVQYELSESVTARDTAIRISNTLDTAGERRCASSI